MQVFADAMIEKLNALTTAKWKKPWFSKGVQPPVNLDGRPYSGGNSFFLSFCQEAKGYEIPIWGTFNSWDAFNGKKDKSGKFIRATDKEGNPLPYVGVQKGEKSVPVYFVHWFAVNAQTRERISISEYHDLSPQEQKDYIILSSTKIYAVFSIYQTNMKEARPELYQSYLEKYTQTPVTTNAGSFPLADVMLSTQSWICPIFTDGGDSAYYTISKKEIHVPNKEQFFEWENFYGTLFHEMAHSTGAEGVLNRLKPAAFGSKDYAREELVAEISAAVTLQHFGICKTLKEDSVTYVKSWLSSLKEEPEFIRTVMKDVSRATAFMTDTMEKLSTLVNEGDTPASGEHAECA